MSGSILVSIWEAGAVPGGGSGEVFFGCCFFGRSGEALGVVWRAKWPLYLVGVDFTLFGSQEILENTENLDTRISEPLLAILRLLQEKL